MNPQIIIILDEKGIRTTRIVANSLEEQKRGEVLYGRILNTIEILDKAISAEDKDVDENEN